ncbi:MAG: hypothetical protein ACK45K_07720, partial [Burkholderiaceae bacterium]
LTNDWARRRLLLAAGAGRQQDEAVRVLMAHLADAAHRHTAPTSSARRERSPMAKARRPQ